MINAIALKLRLQGKAIVSYGPDVLWPTATLLNAEESSSPALNSRIASDRLSTLASSQRVLP